MKTLEVVHVKCSQWQLVNLVLRDALWAHATCYT